MSDNTLLKDWLTTQEASKFMGCSINNIWQLVSRGMFPNCIKIGNMIMIPLSDITSLQEERRRKKEERLKKTKFIVPKRDLGLWK